MLSLSQLRINPMDWTLIPPHQERNRGPFISNHRLIAMFSLLPTSRGVGNSSKVNDVSWDPSLVGLEGRVISRYHLPRLLLWGWVSPQGCGETISAVKLHDTRLAGVDSKTRECLLSSIQPSGEQSLVTEYFATSESGSWVRNRRRNSFRSVLSPRWARVLSMKAGHHSSESTRHFSPRACHWHRCLARSRICRARIKHLSVSL